MTPDLAGRKHVGRFFELHCFALLSVTSFVVSTGRDAPAARKHCERRHMRVRLGDAIVIDGLWRFYSATMNIRRPCCVMRAAQHRLERRIDGRACDRREFLYSSP